MRQGGALEGELVGLNDQNTVTGGGDGGCGVMGHSNGDGTEAPGALCGFRNTGDLSGEADENHEGFAGFAEAARIIVTGEIDAGGNVDHTAGQLFKALLGSHGGAQRVAAAGHDNALELMDFFQCESFFKAVFQAVAKETGHIENARNFFSQFSHNKYFLSRHGFFVYVF